MNELGGVVRNLVSHTAGEVLRQTVERLAHRLGSVQSIRAWLQVHTESSVLLTVERGHQRVVLGTQLDPCNVLEQQAGTGVIGAQDDVFKLFRVGEPALGGHRVGEILLLLERLLAEAAGGELRVLLTDRIDHIGRRQVVLRQLVRTQPDAHGIVFRAELADITHARQTLEFVDHVDQRIVADIHRVARTIRRVEGDHLKNVRRLLLHLDALPAHFFR